MWLRSIAVDRFLTDLEHVVDDVFDRLVEQAAVRGLLDMAYRIDSTDVRAMPSDPDASKCYDSTAEEYYYGYGCTIVSTGSKIPIAAEFTESKQASEETAIARTIRSTGTTTCLASRSCQLLRTTRETPLIRSISSTGSKTGSRTTAETLTSNNRP